MHPLMLLLTLSIVTTTRGQVAGSAFSLGNDPGRRLVVRLYDLANVSATVLRRATDEASGIFADVGVETVWEVSDPNAEEAHTVELNSPASLRADKLRNRAIRSYVAVRIGRGMSGRTPDRALGVSMLGSQNGVNITIFEDRVENLCTSSALNLSMFLGHVIAHELGHVLLESTEHAATGIMRARWGKADFAQASMGHLRFSFGEGATIRRHSSLQPGSRNVELPVRNR